MAREVSLKMPRVEAAVLLIKRGEKALAIHNVKWGAFTLPISRRRSWRDSEFPNAKSRKEEWTAAASRIAAEILGKTFLTTAVPKPLLELQGFKQSDSDGKWKIYNLHIFELLVEGDVGLAYGINGEWLSARDFKQRQPISPTARYVIDHLLLEGHLS